MNVDWTERRTGRGGDTEIGSLRFLGWCGSPDGVQSGSKFGFVGGQSNFPAKIDGCSGVVALRAWACYRSSMSGWKMLGMAEKAAEGKESLQLINGDGELDITGLDAFARHIKLADCGLSYAVVAIMGPQSSGKSTLLNHLFATEFREMDALSGRNQTTQGVWLSRAAGISPCTIVMDLEGTDGRERGEDDTAFEKQSALFALAVSDIVIINMWCHDIGREQAANKPLLKTVFQVMVRLFTPRKTTLLFVIRDKTRTPMDVLEPILREDVSKIWESAPKPQAFEGVELSDCFNVKVTALSNYEDKPEVFEDQVADLRERFKNSIAPGGLAGDRRAVVPGTAFPVSSSSIWKVIKENKDLDLPAHKVMVATVRCEEIANEKLTDFQQNEVWVDLNENSKTGVVHKFGMKLNALLDKYTSEYDQEVSYFDENVRASKRNYLLQQILEIVNPAYQQVLTHHRVGAIESFRKNVKDWADTADGGDGFANTVRHCSDTALSGFDKGVVDAKISYAQWDSSKFREKLRRDIDSHAATVRNDKINAIVADANKRLEASLGEPTAALLESATPDTWTAIRDLLRQDGDLARASLLSALSGYELDESEEHAIVEDMANYGRTVIENEARKEVAQALLRMKDRFTTSFSHDADAMPRVWSDKDDVRALARDARSASLKGLSVLAAIRLDDNSPDRIEPVLLTLLGDTQDGSRSKAGSLTLDGEASSITVSNPLAASSWEGIRTEQTLLNPPQCKTLWRQFKAETDYAIRQALANQEASRKGNSWLPPPWAIAAMIVLGFNEFMALLRNPLYLLIGFVIYLLGKALWIQLDVDAEFRHGLIPGLLGVSSKIVPTIMNFLTKLAQEGSRVGETNPTSSNGSSDATSSLNRAGSDVINSAQDFNKTVDSESAGVRNRQPTRRPVHLDS